MRRPNKPLPSVEKIKELLDYDPVTGHLTWKETRRRRKKGARAGYVDNLGYRVLNCGGRVYYKAHRLVWKLMTGENPEGTIDHINGNRDDNRFENLRLATMSQQNWNKPTKGYWRKGKKFQVRVRKHNRVVFDKTFATEEEAIKARDEQRAIHHNEFATQ